MSFGERPTTLLPPGHPPGAPHRRATEKARRAGGRRSGLERRRGGTKAPAREMENLSEPGGLQDGRPAPR